LKWGAIGSLVAAAVVAVPLIAGNFSGKRRLHADDVPLPPELDIPPVSQFVPQQASQPETLMGVEPVEGSLAKRVKMQRAGLSSGVDAGAPSIMRPDGTNAIDGGRAAEDLGAPAIRGV
jgi:hypothetical protein